MARPQKQTVTYFPHDCRHGKTLVVIEQRYGNDGYALWFKTLELLGDSEGHFIDCTDVFTWEYYLTRMRLDEGRCSEILTLLAKLGAIDSKLWTEERIIWSDNFVAGISDAYEKRTTKLPTKPGFRGENPSFRDGNPSFRDGNPQIKVKKSKADKTKADKTKEPPPPIFSCESFEVSADHLDALLKSHPGFTRDYLLQSFLPKMENWCLDHRSDAKHSRKFDGDGRLREPRRCLANWIKNETPPPGEIRPQQVGTPAPPRDPEGWQRVYDPDCPRCQGSGWNTSEPGPAVPCDCGKMEQLVYPVPACPKCGGDGITKTGVCDCLSPRLTKNSRGADQ